MRKRGALQSIGEREGVASTTTGTDVWRGISTVIATPDQTTGESISFTSANANDTAAGTGVQEVLIHYLDDNWEPQTETNATNGGTVNLAATNIKFIQDVHATQVGSSGVAAGDITVHKTGTPATIYDLIATGGNFSLTISKMIPAGFNFSIARWTASASAGNKPLFIRIRSTDHVGMIFPGTYMFKDTCTLEAGGSYIREWDERSRILLPEKSIIKVSVWAIGSGANVASSFEGELVGMS